MSENNERTAGEQLAYMGTDAARWTDEFLRIREASPPLKGGDEWGWVVGWFANAIEAGRAAQTPREESAERTADAATAFLRSGHDR